MNRLCLLTALASSLRNRKPRIPNDRIDGNDNGNGTACQTIVDEKLLQWQRLSVERDNIQEGRYLQTGSKNKNGVDRDCGSHLERKDGRI